MSTASSSGSLSWRTPLVVIVCAGIVLSLNMGIRQTFGLFIVPMNESVGISIGSFSLAVAVQNLLWGLATPIAAALADRYGAGRMLIGGALIYAAGLALMALLGSELGVHLGGGILVGLAVAASGFPMVLGAVARSTPPETRARALGFASAGGSAGQFILLPFTQQLIGSLEWFGALLVLAALSLLIVPLAAALKGRAGSGAGEGATSLRNAIVEAGGHRGYQLLTCGFFVCGFHVAFVATHLPGYILANGLSGMVGATALGLIGFFNIIGGLGAGVLGGRIRKKYLLSGIYLARAVAIALFILGPKTEMAVWLFSASFGLLWLSTVPLTSGMVGDIFGARYMGTLFGLVMMGHQFGAFLGAWLGGLSFDMIGSYEPVWWISVGLGVLAALLHFPIADKAVQRQALPVAGR